MFITEETRKILLQMADLQPDDASVHYALYQVSRESKANRAVALRHLADAVQRDSVYAYEYLLLAALALEKKRPDEAVRVLRLASESNPENPFMTLEYARALLSERQTSSAIPLLETLLSLNWSQTFYPDMPGQLEKLLAELSQ
jgi:predicted Zn-dependent protease